VEVRDDGFLEPAITTRLSGVGFYWGSPVRVSADSAKGLERIEILKSSKASWTSDDVSQVATIDYQVPAEGTEPQLLAVALQGEFDSYFAHRPPPASSGEETGQAASGDVALMRSPATRLTVIGNAEFLSDLIARIVSQQGGFFAQNLAFMQNLIDWMNLDNDLIAIRARSAGASRIERVEKPAQLTLETLNYLIPLGAVLAFGMWKLVRRRRVTPIVAGRSRAAGGTAAEAQA
jgi:ABC-2 type transport system permease protein